MEDTSLKLETSDGVVKVKIEPVDENLDTSIKVTVPELVIKEEFNADDKSCISISDALSVTGLDVKGSNSKDNDEVTPDSELRKVHAPRLKNLDLYVGTGKEGCPVWKCNLCDFNTDVSYFLQLHIIKEHPDHLYSCSPCEKLFYHKSSLRYHQRVCHSKDEAFSCSKCSFVSNSYASYNDHRKSHLDVIHCDHCDFKTSYKHRLSSHKFKIHKIKVKGFKSAKCSICGRTYSDLHHLRQHQKSRHLGIKYLQTIRFNCTLCEFKSVTSHTLRKHKREMHKHCSTCSLILLDEKSLKIHEKSHLKHSCSLCPVMKSSLRELEDHCLSVHGVKSHECFTCKKAFLRARGLRKHQCPLIGLQLKTNPSLERKSKTSNSPSEVVSIVCVYCSEHFPTLKVLKKHLKYCVFK